MAASGGELPTVEAEAVERRPLDALKVTVRNPFPPLLLSEKIFLIDDGTGKKNDGESSEPTVLGERRPAFVLRLDSIFSRGIGSGHARINGRDVEVGGVITDCDPGSPPVLVGLSGLTARVGHRGQSYDLHLDLVPRLELGGEVIRHELPMAAESAEEMNSAEVQDINL